MKKPNITCPTCKKPSTWATENKFRPFCSERCKLIDLGEWADEKYRVGAEPVDPNEIPHEKKED